MTTDQTYLTVARDCYQCAGRGTYGTYGLADRQRCGHCDGSGKQPIYIPIDELDSPLTRIMVRSIRDWMRDHDAEVDHLAKELEASGLVADPPAQPAKETPDLAVAAQQLLKELQNWHPVQTRQAGKTALMLAIVEVKECLDGRGCALPRNPRVEAVLARMDRVATEHNGSEADTVCLLAGLLHENESLGAQVVSDVIGHDVYYRLRDQVDLEAAGDGNIVRRAFKQGERDEGS